MLKLNIGCGGIKFPDCVNMDRIRIDGAVEPDIICDITKEALPQESNSVDVILFLHCVEHIEIIHWPHVFYEFYRVLKPEGELILAYPEFETCVKYYLENYKGAKEYWRACLYGAQRYEGDYHVTPVSSVELMTALQKSGFHNIKFAPDKFNDHNSSMIAHKGATKTNEDLLRKEIFQIA